MNKILNLFSQCGHWILPPHCCLCNKTLTSQQWLCTACRRILPWNIAACRQCGLPIETGQQCGACLTHPPAFQQCIAPFRYQQPISTLIIQLKFHQKLQYAQVLSQLLSEAVQKHQQTLPECIIPVPLHTRRIQQRGFNQAVEIARPLSKKLNIPLLYDYCYRRKHTLPQSALSAHARRRNMTAAFALRQKIKFSHVAVIDDVMTTGQTVQVLSQMLLSQGIKKIDVWCCARAT